MALKLPSARNYFAFWAHKFVVIEHLGAPAIKSKTKSQLVFLLSSKAPALVQIVNHLILSTSSIGRWLSILSLVQKGSDFTLFVCRDLLSYRFDPSRTDPLFCGTAIAASLL